MAATSPHPLEGIRDKISRAEELIDIICDEFGQLLQDNIYTVQEQKDVTNRVHHFLASGPPLSRRYSLLLGEVVHHLRSCFDHMVWQLVLVAGNTPGHKHEFPICETPEKFAEAVKRK